MSNEDGGSRAGGRGERGVLSDIFLIIYSFGIDLEGCGIDSSSFFRDEGDCDDGVYVTYVM